MLTPSSSTLRGVSNSSYFEKGGRRSGMGPSKTNDSYYEGTIDK